MEVYFNELCLNQTTMIQYADISRIGTLYKRLRSRNILGCRISHNDYAEVIRQAGTMPGTNPNVISFLFAFLRQPYENEGVEERQEDVSFRIVFQNRTKNGKTPTYSSYPKRQTAKPMHMQPIYRTGRNRRETEKIAEILKEKYGSM